MTPGAKNVIIPLLKAPVEEENPPDAKDIRVSFIGSPTASPTRKVGGFRISSSAMSLLLLNTAPHCLWLSPVLAKPGAKSESLEAGHAALLCGHFTGTDGPAASDASCMLTAASPVQLRACRDCCAIMRDPARGLGLNPKPCSPTPSMRQGAHVLSGKGWFWHTGTVRVDKTTRKPGSHRCNCTLSTQELHELYGRDWFWYKGGSSWKEHLGRSDFSICPVGFGQASFRLAEAIALETIPVYVWESVKMLPYTVRGFQRRVRQCQIGAREAIPVYVWEKKVTQAGPSRRAASLYFDVRNRRNSSPIQR